MRTLELELLIQCCADTHRGRQCERGVRGPGFSITSFIPPILPYLAPAPDFFLLLLAFLYDLGELA